MKHQNWWRASTRWALAWPTDVTSGDVFAEAGVEVARGLSVFGSVGQFRNLQPSAAQPAVDTTTSLLSSSLATGRLTPVTGSHVWRQTRRSTRRVRRSASDIGFDVRVRSARSDRGV